MVGPTDFNNHHWSGSDNQRLRVSAYHAPVDRTPHFLLAPPVKSGGFQGENTMSEGALFALDVESVFSPLNLFLVTFCRSKK